MNLVLVLRICFLLVLRRQVVISGSNISSNSIKRESETATTTILTKHNNNLHVSSSILLKPKSHTTTTRLFDRLHSEGEEQEQEIEGITSSSSSHKLSITTSQEDDDDHDDDKCTHQSSSTTNCNKKPNLFKRIQNIMGQTISTTQFFLYGRKHFTKVGYENHVKQYYNKDHPVQLSATIGIKQDGADGVDLTNKVIVITGANSGLGKEITTYAVSKNAKVYMLCRSKERAEQARQDILNATKECNISDEQNVKILLADVGELDQVRNVVQELQSKEDHVDALVCNAGVLLNDKNVTSTGMEVTFASHFLGGSYLLSQLLIPQLEKSTDGGKVIFVSSAGMYNTKFPAWSTATSTNNDLKYDGQFAYAYAKRGQVLLAEEMTRRHPDKNISWVSCHPGWADTNAVNEAYGDTKKYLEPLRSAWEGAEGICWLLGKATKQDLVGGAFYLDRKPQRKHFAGPFFTEGSYTKNTQTEIDEMMNQLKQAAGL